MLDKIDAFFQVAAQVFWLWAYGWKSRSTRRYGQSVTEWRDPESGLWYILDPAMRVLKARARDELRQR